VQRSVPVYDTKRFTEKARALGKRPSRAGEGSCTNGEPRRWFRLITIRVRFPSALHDEHLPRARQLDGHELRRRFEHRKKRCWACSLAHNRFTKITQGPHAGLETEEPDYESISAWGSLVGNPDPPA